MEPLVKGAVGARRAEFDSKLTTQSGGRGLPAKPVAAHAVVAPESHHDHRRGRLVDRVADRGLEAGPVGDRAVDQPVQARDLREVETERGREDLFEDVQVLSLRQEVEDAAAVVVADDDRRLDAMPPDRPQPVHVVIRGEIAEQEDRRNVAAAGGDSKTSRDETIDAARAAIAEETLLWFGQRPEAVGGSDR